MADDDFEGEITDLLLGLPDAPPSSGGNGEPASHASAHSDRYSGGEAASRELDRSAQAGDGPAREASLRARVHELEVAAAVRDERLARAVDLARSRASEVERLRDEAEGAKHAAAAAARAVELQLDGERSARRHERSEAAAALAQARADIDRLSHALRHHEDAATTARETISSLESQLGEAEANARSAVRREQLEAKRVREAEVELTSLREMVKGLQRETGEAVSRAGEAQRVRESTTLSAAERIADLERQLDESRAAAQVATAECEALDRRVAEVEARAAIQEGDAIEAAARAEALLSDREATIVELQQRLDAADVAAEEARTQADGTLKQHHEELIEARASVVEAESARDGANRAAAAAKADVQQLKVRYEALRKHCEAAAEELCSSASLAQELKARLDESEAARSALSAELDEAAQQIRELKQSTTQLESRVEDQSAALAAADSKIEELEHALRASEVQTAESQQQAARAQHQLAKLVRAATGYDDAETERFVSALAKSKPASSGEEHEGTESSGTVDMEIALLAAHARIVELEDRAMRAEQQRDEAVDAAGKAQVGAEDAARALARANGEVAASCASAEQYRADAAKEIDALKEKHAKELSAAAIVSDQDAAAEVSRVKYAAQEETKALRRATQEELRQLQSEMEGMLREQAAVHAVAIQQKDEECKAKIDGLQAELERALCVSAELAEGVDATVSKRVTQEVEKAAAARVEAEQAHTEELSRVRKHAADSLRAARKEYEQALADARENAERTIQLLTGQYDAELQEARQLVEAATAAHRHAEGSAGAADKRGAVGTERDDEAAKRAAGSGHGLIQRRGRSSSRTNGGLPPPLRGPSPTSATERAKRMKGMEDAASRLTALESILAATAPHGRPRSESVAARELEASRREVGKLQSRIAELEDDMSAAAVTIDKLRDSVLSAQQQIVASRQRHTQEVRTLREDAERSRSTTAVLRGHVRRMSVFAPPSSPIPELLGDHDAEAGEVNANSTQGAPASASPAARKAPAQAQVRNLKAELLRERALADELRAKLRDAEERAAGLAVRAESRDMDPDGLSRRLEQAEAELREVRREAEQRAEELDRIRIALESGEQGRAESTASSAGPDSVIVSLAEDLFRRVDELETELSSMVKQLSTSRVNSSSEREAASERERVAAQQIADLKRDLARQRQLRAVADSALARERETASALASALESASQELQEAKSARAWMGRALRRAPKPHDRSADAASVSESLVSASELEVAAGTAPSAGSDSHSAVDASSAPTHPSDRHRRSPPLPKSEMTGADFTRLKFEYKSLFDVYCELCRMVAELAERADAVPDIDMSDPRELVAALSAASGSLSRAMVFSDGITIVHAATKKLGALVAKFIDNAHARGSDRFVATVSSVAALALQRGSMSALSRAAHQAIHRTRAELEQHRGVHHASVAQLRASEAELAKSRDAERDARVRADKADDELRAAVRELDASRETALVQSTELEQLRTRVREQESQWKEERAALQAQVSEARVSSAAGDASEPWYVERRMLLDDNARLSQRTGRLEEENVELMAQLKSLQDNIRGLTAAGRALSRENESLRTEMSEVVAAKEQAVALSEKKTDDRQQGTGPVEHGAAAGPESCARCRAPDDDVEGGGGPVGSTTDPGGSIDEAVESEATESGASSSSAVEVSGPSDADGPSEAYGTAAGVAVVTPSARVDGDADTLATPRRATLAGVVSVLVSTPTPVPGSARRMSDPLPGAGLHGTRTASSAIGFRRYTATAGAAQAHFSATMDAHARSSARDGQQSPTREAAAPDSPLPFGTALSSSILAGAHAMLMPDRRGDALATSRDDSATSDGAGGRTVQEPSVADPTDPVPGGAADADETDSNEYEDDDVFSDASAPQGDERGEGRGDPAAVIDGAGRAVGRAHRAEGVVPDRIAARDRVAGASGARRAVEGVGGDVAPAVRMVDVDDDGVPFAPDEPDHAGTGGSADELQRGICATCQTRTTGRWDEAVAQFFCEGCWRTYYEQAAAYAAYEAGGADEDGGAGSEDDGDGAGGAAGGSHDLSGGW